MVHQSDSQYYAEMIKLMQKAHSHMNESIKVHYRINGLRLSLFTETRRNYSKIAHFFSMIDDDLIPSTSFSRSTANATSTNDFKGYSRNSNDDNHYYKDHYSSNDFNGQKITLPMSMEMEPIGFPVKLSNSTKATPNKQLYTITTSSQFTTTQQQIFYLLDHITNRVQHNPIQSLLFKF
ncbi:unnamed protein product [Rotaria sp. Silwood2]|nr:unnamed protein product [Rotaria sp. Silwood2]CAF2949209.1 unnamed protein product [Rotaria sp. Silwood2]CAF3059908.1 unnamed protein product [Rotaria sp. Silwood2]CAF3339064.1 unnamed protein product [Rotaria sp. Silwood2]CAF3950854.1 unnamed protein product [Rotaria sp. Silwood2]